MTPIPERLRITGASIRLDSMPRDGRDLDLTVDKPERDGLAVELGVLSLDRLQVKLHAVRFKGGIRVTGRLTAIVTQQSVISFEPVVQEIGEPIDRIFLPGAEKDHADKADAEVFVDLEGEDIPDHFDGNEADLSDLIVETIALGIDPYPRAPGESIDSLGLAEAEAEIHPFAALKKLKQDLDES
jgi:Large ribosomal RNA subunit accumulation protein YceD